MCGSEFEANPGRERIWKLATNVPFYLLIVGALHGGVSWPNAIGMSALVLLLDFIAYPYVAKYDPIEWRLLDDPLSPDETWDVPPED